MQSPALGRDQPRATGTLRFDWLESCLAKQNLGILVDNKLNKNQQCALVTRFFFIKPSLP